MKRLALVVALAACHSGSASPRQAAPPPRVFVTMCAPCHGADAHGYRSDHAPSLVSSTFLESASDTFLRDSIIYGRPGTPMPPYGKVVGGPLDGAAVDQIVAWLRAQGPAPHALPAPRGGDPMRGAPIYAQDCQTCHGDTVRRGQFVFLANMRFQALASDGYLRWAIAHGRPGTKMQAWAGKLSDAQIDDVVAYVRQLGTPHGVREPLAQPNLLPPPTGKEPLVLNPTGKAPDFTLRADPCPPARPGCTPDPRFVPAAQVKLALEQKRRLIIIDARPPSDWMRVHIPGAVSIPHYDMHRLSEIPRDGTWIVAYCACPHHLSGIVLDELRKRGYTHTAVLDEGILEWHRRGYPVVAAPGVQPPPAEPAPPPGGAIR